MRGLALRLLGAPRITIDGQAVHFDTRKAVALLAYLACTGRPHSREALAALLWPEYAGARNALRRTLSSLQQVLGPGWLESGREQVALARRTDCWVDVAAFEAHTGPDADDTLLAAGVDLYAGDLLDGFTLRDSIAFDDWHLFESERLRQRLAQSLARLVGRAIETGQHALGIEMARRWLALDPLNELAHRALMELYARADQRTAALRQYRVCAQRLEQELGVLPDDATVQLYELIQMGGMASPLALAPPPAPLMPAAPAPVPGLVGRDTELRALYQLYQRTRGASLVALTGQPGIGKTRLADGLLTLVRQAGGVVLSVRCYEGEATLPYTPIAALLRAALSALERTGTPNVPDPAVLAEAGRLLPTAIPHPAETPLADPEARRKFFEAVATVLGAACAGAAPAVLLIDDVHWADGASLDMLAFLLRRMEHLRVLCVLIWREEDTPPAHPARALLGEARRAGRGEQFTLAPLAPEAVAALAQRDGPLLAPDAVARLAAESAGVPLFVVEYLVALRDGALAHDAAYWPLPVRARDLLEARMRPLRETTRPLLAAAAVAGASFDLPLLCAAAVIGEEDAIDGLEELLQRGLLIEASATPLRYTFGHEQVRALAYEHISTARRRLIHRRIALHLADAYAATRRSGLAAQVAVHAAAAGQRMLAAIHHRLAADEARMLAANGEAANHYQSALAFDAPDTGEAHEALGDLRALAGAYADALRHYEAAAHAGQIVTRKIGDIYYRLGRWHDAEACFAPLVYEPTADTAERALACAAWSLTARRRGDLALAAQLAEEALVLADTSGAPRAQARAHGVAGTLAAALHDQDRARAALERSITLAEQVDDPDTRVSALNSLARTLATTDPARAIVLAETALGLCLARDDRHRAAALHNTLADLRHACGERDASLAHLRAAVALFAAIGHDQPEIWMFSEW